MRLAAVCRASTRIRWVEKPGAEGIAQFQQDDGVYVLRDYCIQGYMEVLLR